MTSKYHNQSSSRRHPLKRVRPDNENQGSIISSNGRINKKFCRQLSEGDSAFVEIEKSSDERAYDLFHKEYFSQFRPYFKHRSIVLQFIEHLWVNMIESSKFSFVKKILKEQGLSDISSTNINDENDSQLNESNRNLLTLNSTNKYNRNFLHDLLSYLKYFITPRFIDMNSSTKILIPLRRSSRIRRAPIKCSCATCITTGPIEEHSFTNEKFEHKIFHDLINHYHQLDDQYIEQDKQIILNETNDSQIQMPLSEIIETETHVQSSSPMISVNSNEISLPPEIDLSINSNEKIISDECTTRRTYVILTELDEPFFGPYPIEFTITI